MGKCPSVPSTFRLNFLNLPNHRGYVSIQKYKSPHTPIPHIKFDVSFSPIINFKVISTQNPFTLPIYHMMDSDWDLGCFLKKQLNKLLS